MPKGKYMRRKRGVQSPGDGGKQFTTDFIPKPARLKHQMWEFANIRQATLEEVNKMGSIGWELVCVERADYSVLVWFKRRLPQAGNGDR